MPKKQIIEQGKKEVILTAALESFLENGYESTSVRNISQKVGCEVGLIYYYFKTKEELFEQALEVYYVKAEKEMKAIAESNDASVEKFIAYLEKKANSYKKIFTSNVHFSVRAAICDKIASLAEAYLTSILEKTNKEGAKNIAIFLSRGLCRVIISDDPVYYGENKEDILKIVNSVINIKTNTKIEPETETKESVVRKKDIPSFLL